MRALVHTKPRRLIANDRPDPRIQEAPVLGVADAPGAHRHVDAGRAGRTAVMASRKPR